MIDLSPPGEPMQAGGNMTVDYFYLASLNIQCVNKCVNIAKQGL